MERDTTDIDDVVIDLGSATDETKGATVGSFDGGPTLRILAGLTDD